MNKKIIYICLLLMTTTACEKELIQYPITTKTADNFYQTEAELEEAVLAVYASLQFTGNFQTGIPAIGELPGEDVYDETPANDGGVYGQLDEFNVIAQSGLIADVWENSYQGIQRANIVLNRISDITFASDNTKNSRIGEMKFIRALLYFNLVRTFGDVPLVIEEVESPQDLFGQARSSKEDVYAQIEKDLTEAISVLPIRTESNKTRVFKSAAQGLLGKVFLTLKKYNEAKTQLNAVESSGIHQLLESTEAVFSVDNKLNKEILFAVQYASGINGNSEGTDAYRMFNPAGRVENGMTGTKGHGVIIQSFVQSYEENDTRMGSYIGALGSGLGFSKKIAVPTTVIGDSPSDWVVLRYADVILMLAEIENQLGNSSAAISYLNKIRTRAGLIAYTGANDNTSIFNEIDIQRRKELIWEGHRWFDLLRQDRAQSVLGISDANRLLMPLPASQIATDNTLKQNPGY